MKKLLIAYFLLIVLSIPLFSQPFEFSYPVNISNIGWDWSMSPSIDIDDKNTIHVAFRHFDKIEDRGTLYYCKGSDNNWSESIALTDSGDIFSPKIIIDKKGRIYIAYQMLYHGEYFKSFLIIKEQNIWQKPIQISDDSLGLGFNPYISLDKYDILNIFYCNFSGIFFRKYERNELSQVEKIYNFPRGGTTLTKPIAKADSNNAIHLIFSDYDYNLRVRKLYYMNKIDDKWNYERQISLDDSFSGPRDYDFEIDKDNNLHVIYSQAIKDTIVPYYVLYYTRKNGNHWSIPQSITSKFNGNAFVPKIRINPQNNKPIIISYFDYRENGIHKKNFRFVYLNNGNWIVTDILNKYPKFEGKWCDYDFDTEANLNYIFTRTDTLHPALDELYYSKGSLITYVKENSFDNNKSIKLEAFPNPFNSSVIIDYRLPEESIINLTLYNILGETIREVLKNEQKVGNNRIQLETQGLPSGVYIIELKTKERRKSIKILLTK